MVGKVSLLLVMGFGLLLMILGLNLNSDATQAVSNMASYTESSESHELAVSGANIGLALVYADSSWRGPVTKTFGNGSFTAGEGNGERPLVVSYASSPAAAVYFSDPRPKQAPIGTVLDTCFDQVEFGGVLKGSSHRKAATALVDFMLSEEFQRDIPLQMFVFPARSDVALPPVFRHFAQVPAHPATMTPTSIGLHRADWIDEWTDTVLR